MAVLKQQLKEAKKLKFQAEKAKIQAEEDKVRAEKERDEAEQHGYDVGVAETEDALRAEVPAVCHAYCTQTWEEALNRAGIEASSEQISSQKEVAPLAPQLVKEAQSQHPPSTSQQEQGREQEILKGPSSDKVAEAPQPGVASQDFEKQISLSYFTCKRISEG